MGNINSNSVEAYNEASMSEIATIFGLIPMKLSIEMIGVLTAVLAVSQFILFDIPDEVMGSVDALGRKDALLFLNNSAIATEISQQAKALALGCRVSVSSTYESGCLVRELSRYKYVPASDRTEDYANLLVYNGVAKKFTAIICIPKGDLGLTIGQLVREYRQADIAAGQFNNNQQLKCRTSEPISRRMHLSHNFS